MPAADWAPREFGVQGSASAVFRALRIPYGCIRLLQSVYLLQRHGATGAPAFGFGGAPYMLAVEYSKDSAGFVVATEGVFLSQRGYSLQFRIISIL